MTNRSRKQVEREAQELLDRFSVTKPPIDVERIARKLRYEVLFEHFPGDVSGTLMRDEDDVMTIGINSFHAFVRQRFSIAHEIGHGELHVRPRAGTAMFVDPPGAQVLFRDKTSSLGEDPKEIQANQFAAALLMPRGMVSEVARRIVDKEKAISVDEFVEALATRFEVSGDAMRFRLVNLGIVEPN